MEEKIATNITDLIGNTPLLELKTLSKNHNVKARIVAKLEYFNPAGSVKDRIAKAMIDKAMQEGKITKDTVIIEPTSGNTGVGLAAVASSYGLKLILTMPETMSQERRALLTAYGAKLVLTKGAEGMKGAIDMANKLKNETPNSFIPGQFTNSVNPQTHKETTGPEIYKDTNKAVAAFVAGVGTGGTISGTGAYLKSQNPNIKVFAVEPQSSPVLSKGVSGAHKIQGIGAGFIPDTLDTKIYDEVIPIANEDAISLTKEVARTQGLLVGISSGAALKAALQVGSREEFRDKIIVVLLPDTGERYLSTGIFA